MSGITISGNKSLFFQAEDKDGNVIATNSISIYKIGKMDPNNFVVDIKKVTGKGLQFTASFLDNEEIYSDIYVKLDTVDGLRINEKLPGNISFADNSKEFLDYRLINAGSTWNIINNSLNEVKFVITFQVRNRTTGNVTLVKQYGCNVDVVGSGSVTGGIINPGGDDQEIMTPENDDNIANNYDVGIDWNANNAVDTAKDFFENAVEFFNLILNFLYQMPSWITIPLYTLFTLAVIVFVFHVIRG